MNRYNIQKTNTDLFLIGLIVLLLVFTHWSNQTQKGMEPKVKSVNKVMRW